MEQFRAGATDRGNELFQFSPRVAAGQAVASEATAMMDSSDGLARSLHQLSEASDCGFRNRVRRRAGRGGRRRGHGRGRRLPGGGALFGEDFELVFTVPEEAVDDVAERSPTAVTRIGRATREGILMDGDPLEDRGYTHG
ncbi:hypothetical protein ACFQH2_01290 [Natronoarchaeum sp. GCM10025703]|uniref:hypothetical protein n=1 Tax=Natronoarchaeum sp. GCM10025703 TaxID=3252685 RepID=UPI003621BAC4